MIVGGWEKFNNWPITLGTAHERFQDTATSTVFNVMALEVGVLCI